jgi:general secretion pathway protein D
MMLLKISHALPAAALVAIALALPAADAGAKKQFSPAAQFITLEFRDVEMREFLARMSDIIGKNIIFDDRVTGRISIYPGRRVRASEALAFMKSVLEYRGYAVVDSGEFLKVLPIEDAVHKNSTIIIDMSR